MNWPRVPRIPVTTTLLKRTYGIVVIALAVVLSGCASTAAADNPASEPQSQQREHSEQSEPYQDANILPADEATVVAFDEDYYDPLIKINRAIFSFNNYSYRYVLIPTAKAYRAVTPDPVEVHIGQFFNNIKAPISIINHLLQWEPGKAGRMTGRFLMNTTVGILGVFDPAKAWLDLDEEKTGFSDTLRDYGSGRGPYLVLPFLGPSDLRGGAGVVGDYFANPVPYLTEQPETGLIMAADTLQSFSSRAELYKKLYDNAEDPYLFFRNMYLQGQERDEFYNSTTIYTGASPD